MATRSGRRVPWVLALAVVVAVAGALVALSAFRAQQQARRDAEQQAARTAFADALDDHRAALAAPARAADDTLAALQLTLQEHLTVSDRDDEQLAADRDRLAGELEQLAERLRSAASAALPGPAAVLREEATASLVEAVGILDEGAIVVADELEATAAGARAWGEGVERLRTAGADFVVAVDRGADSDDPEQLVATWRAELQALDRYEAAVAAIAGTDGLEALVGAHRGYVESNRSAVEELIDLLESDRIDAYNARLDERFGGDDPFGFDRAVTEAATSALQAGAPRRARTTRQRVLALLDALDDLRRQVPDVLAGA